jgi:Tol biopolymer transport system component
MNRIIRAVIGGAVSAATAATVFAVTAPAAGAQAAPDGRIVYVAATGFGTNSTYDIHVMNADGTGDVNLTPDATPEDGTDESQELDPVWSPDGTRIAFISNRVTEGNPDGNYEIFTMGADGSAVTQITFANPENGWEFWQSYEPNWSPDGTQIAFNGYRQWGSSEIFTVPADGSGTEFHVTNGVDPANKWEPQWSPDGSTILFTWGWDEYYQDLHTISPDGTNEVDLTADAPDSSERNPAWSPDGTRIAFRTDRDCCGIYPNVNAEIYVMEYPSGTLTRVTDDPALDEDPTWSPDGSQIIFTSLRGGSYDLYVVDAPPVPAPAATSARLSASGDAATLAAADGASPVTSGSGNEEDPNWGTTAAADLTAPRSTLTRPRDGRSYARADMRQVRGTATDDRAVTRVQVALRRNMVDGTTQWWNGSAWVAGAANRPVWRTATGTSTFTYALPALSKSTGASTVADYTVLSRAGDAAGNVERAFRAGRNQATFEIGA